MCVCGKGYGWSKGPTRNDYEASGEFGVRTEGPKRERRIEEDVLPGIRGRWREGEEILRREGGERTLSLHPTRKLFTPQRARGSKRSLTTPDLYRHLTPAPRYPVSLITRVLLPGSRLFLVPRKRVAHEAPTDVPTSRE